MYEAEASGARAAAGVADPLARGTPTPAWKPGAIGTRWSATLPLCHERGEYARDEDSDGFCEVHVNTIEGFWSLLRSWLRPHRGISQDKLPDYLGFFQFVHNARRRDKALLGALISVLIANPHQHLGSR